MIVLPERWRRPCALRSTVGLDWQGPPTAERLRLCWAHEDRDSGGDGRSDSSGVFRAGRLRWNLDTGHVAIALGSLMWGLALSLAAIVAVSLGSPAAWTGFTVLLFAFVSLAAARHLAR